MKDHEDDNHRVAEITEHAQRWGGRPKNTKGATGLRVVTRCGGSSRLGGQTTALPCGAPGALFFVVELVVVERVDLSVIAPAFNELENVEPLVERVGGVFET